MALIRKTDVARQLGRSYSGFEKLLKSDKTFPRGIKFGDSRQSPVFFDQEEIAAWIEAKKATRKEMANA